MSRQKMTASPEFKKNKLKTSKIALKNEKELIPKQTKFVIVSILLFQYVLSEPLKGPLGHAKIGNQQKPKINYMIFQKQMNKLIQTPLQ